MSFIEHCSIMKNNKNYYPKKSQISGWRDDSAIKG